MIWKCCLRFLTPNKFMKEKATHSLWVRGFFISYRKSLCIFREKQESPKRIDIYLSAGI